MAKPALEEEKLQSALQIIQRIFQDEWLVEERSLLMQYFVENFECSTQEIENQFDRFFQPTSRSILSIRVQQAQKKRFSFEEPVQPTQLYYKKVMSMYGAQFGLHIVDAVIAILLKREKDWSQILHTFS